MNWIAILALAFAVVAIGCLAVAINARTDMRLARAGQSMTREWGDKILTEAGVTQRENSELRHALAKEQREHRLLLKNREAKRIAPMDWAERFVGWIGEGRNMRGLFPTCLSELNDDAKEFAYAETSEPTVASARRGRG